MGNTKAAFLHNLVILKTEVSLQAREECRQTHMLSSATAGCVWVKPYELADQIGPPDWDGVLGLHGLIC